MRSFALCLAALAACTDPSVSDEPLLPDEAAPPPLLLAMDNPIIKGSHTASVAGANPSETVYVLRSPGGPGAGPCLPQIGGQCVGILNPVGLHATIATSAAGTGSREVSLPNLPSIDGDTICFQATAIRGTGGSTSVLSNVVCKEAGYDDDEDGIIDALDQCPGFDDYFDWDMDGTSDGCDNPADQPPVFTQVNPIIPLTTEVFQGRNVFYAFPPTVNGIVFMFHGSNGAAEFVEAEEVLDLLNDWMLRGYAFVSISSENRGSGSWDDSTTPASNPDWNRYKDWRQSKITSGALSATAPVHSWGFSGGGKMASYTSHAAPAAGWNFGVAVVQSSNGRSSRYGDINDNFPAVFISAKWDDVVLPADIQANFNDHIAAGGIGLYRMVPERAVAPTSFDRSRHLGLAKSLEFFKIIVDAGYFNKAGERLFPSTDIDGTIDDIGLLPGFSPAPPGKGILSATLATHASHGYYADLIGDYFDAHP